MLDLDIKETVTEIRIYANDKCKFEIPEKCYSDVTYVRKVKNREKMAGGFRKESGHKMYCAIMTMIETFKKRGIAIF